MHEHVVAGLGGDEAVSLVGVEPFHGSNRHVLVPPSIILGGSTHVDATLTPTARDKLDLRVARQNGNLCRAHGDGYGHRLPPPSTTTRVSEHAHQEDEAALCPRSFASGWAASPAGGGRARALLAPHSAMGGCCRSRHRAVRRHRADAAAAASLSLAGAPPARRVGRVAWCPHPIQQRERASGT